MTDDYYVDRGHNRPPEMLELAKETTNQISSWFSDHPVVTNEKHAHDIKMQIDRAKLCMKDLEDERVDKVTPLNQKLDMINEEYKRTKSPLAATKQAMLEALDVYVKAEETKRIAIAETARQKAAELAEVARQAEAMEREELEGIRFGVVGVSVAELTERADEAFDQYARAERQAIRAEAETAVRIGGGMGRALTIKAKEVLVVEDSVAALQDMGLTSGVRDALLTAARAFRKVHGRLPNGITAYKERRTI